MQEVSKINSNIAPGIPKLQFHNAAVSIIVLMFFHYSYIVSIEVFAENLRDPFNNLTTFAEQTAGPNNGRIVRNLSSSLAEVRRASQPASY